LSGSPQEALAAQYAEVNELCKLAESPSWGLLLHRVVALRQAALTELLKAGDSLAQIGEARGRYLQAEYLLNNLDRDRLKGTAQALAAQLDELEEEVAE